MGEQGLSGATGCIKAIIFSHTHIKRKSILKACWANMPYVCWGEH